MIEKMHRTGRLLLDQRSEHSSGASLQEICARADDADLLGRSTVIEIVHEQGGRLIAAERQRAAHPSTPRPRRNARRLGPCLADDPDRMSAYEPDDDPPFDPEDPQWPQAPPPEWVVTGFPGCDPSPPVLREEPRAGDDAVVIVAPDELKTKAPPSTGRKEIWTDTAVVLVAGLRDALADASMDGLWLAGVGAALRVGGAQGRPAAAGAGGRGVVDPDVVRELGDRSEGNDCMLVGPAETVLRVPEFGGGAEGPSSGVGEGAPGPAACLYPTVCIVDPEANDIRTGHKSIGTKDLQNTALPLLQPPDR